MVDDEYHNYTQTFNLIKMTLPYKDDIKFWILSGYLFYGAIWNP